MSSIWGRWLVLILLSCLIVPLVAAIPIYPGNFTAHFINVGEGDAIFLITPANDTILIDAGPNDTMGLKVSDYIQDSGLDLDMVVATHAHKDHLGGITEVIGNSPPSAFVFSPFNGTDFWDDYDSLISLVNQQHILNWSVQYGDYLNLDSSVNISVLNPSYDYANTNDDSIVFLVEYGSIRFLFMADAQTASETRIKNNISDLHAQILKVGEHGSSYASSPTFLAQVDPEVAVIEVGAGNQYDHPANETLQNLVDVGARIYRTDLNGTVVITTDGSGYTVYTEYGPSHNITATAGPGGTIAPNGVVEVDYQATPAFTINPNSIETGSEMIPPVPQSFHGYVDAMGEPVQTGIPVEVRGIGVKTGISGNPFIISEPGKYGGGFSDPKLLVQGNILDGTLLTFYVNGHPAKVSVDGGSLQDTYPFTSGKTTSLNLSVPEPVDNPVLIPSYYVIHDVLVDGISKGPLTSYQFDPVITNHTISATFDPVYLNFTILADSGAGGIISPNGTVNVPAGSSPTFTITPDEGMEILNVTVDNVTFGHVVSYTFINVSRNHTIHATFAPVEVSTWKINATAGAGGTISPDGMTTVFGGENLTYTITPKAGFEILDVKVDNASVGPVSSYTFTNVTMDHTIQGTFVQAVFVIIAEVGPEGMGTITPSGTVDVATGANQTFTMTPDPDQLNCWGGGTRFVVWNITVDGQVIPSQGEPSLLPVNYTFANVSANHTISANFSKMFINAKPFAKFDASPRSGFAPLPVHFSQVLVSNNTGLLWSFGDNSTSTDQNPDHTYSVPGNYTVSLTIWCNESESFTETQPDFIQVLPSMPPIGGNKGFFLVHSNVDGAQVFFDNDFKGNVTNGTLNVSVFVTATPYRTYTVKKSGYNDFTANITRYPGKGETVDLFATLTQGGFFNFNFHFVDFPAMRFVKFPSFYPF